MFLWLKAFHIIFVVCWFAGIFYLPRLFVYHAQAEDDATRKTLSTMETKLYRFVTPFMWLTIALGSGMVALNHEYYFSNTWFWLKLLLVAALITYHFRCGHYVHAFNQGRISHGHVFFRWFNEVPVFALLGIVILAVLKPF